MHNASPCFFSAVNSAIISNIYSKGKSVNQLSEKITLYQFWYIFSKRTNSCTNSAEAKFQVVKIGAFGKHCADFAGKIGTPQFAHVKTAFENELQPECKKSKPSQMPMLIIAQPNAVGSIWRIFEKRHAASQMTAVFAPAG